MYNTKTALITKSTTEPINQPYHHVFKSDHNTNISKFNKLKLSIKSLQFKNHMQTCRHGFTSELISLPGESGGPGGAPIPPGGRPIPTPLPDLPRL